VREDEWFLTAAERGSPATRLDDRRGDGLAWSTGNDVTALVHGVAYFAELLRSVQLMRAGDLLLFTDWRGDPDQRLDEAGHRMSRVFADAAARGVVVKGLLWRSHLDQFALSEQENRHLGEEIEAAGGECVRDMACVQADPTIRSSSYSAILGAPSSMWLLPAGSIYAIAVWTAGTTVAIISVNRWRRSTGRGRHGMMCSCAFKARPSPTSKPYSVSVGKIRLG
jgi:hypothetical protein